MPNQNKKVIERILARKNGAKDNYKIGLIFEGGGMRGQFSSGAAVGFERLGLRECFDVVYGSSSGSCAATYFVSGDIEEGSKVYYKYLSGFRFIKPWKFSKIIDIDYLCDEVFQKKVPMNIGRLTEAKQSLKIYVADEEVAKGYCFTNRDKVNFYNLLKASCAVPGFYNKAVGVGSVKALDGNAAKKLPLEEAITDGCTDILVVTTVPKNYRETEISFIGIVKRLLMGDLNENFKINYNKRVEQYNQTLDVIFGRRPLHKKVNVYTISPAVKISEAEVRANRLRKIEQMAINKVNEAFGGNL